MISKLVNMHILVSGELGVSKGNTSPSCPLVFSLLELASPFHIGAVSRP